MWPLAVRELLSPPRRFFYFNNTRLSFSSPQKRHVPLSVPRSPLSVTKFPIYARYAASFVHPAVPCTHRSSSGVFSSSLYKHSDFISLFPPNHICLWMSSHLVSTIWHIVPISVSPAFCHSYPSPVQNTVLPKLKFASPIKLMANNSQFPYWHILYMSGVSWVCIVVRHLAVYSTCLHTALNAPTLATPYCGHLESLSYLTTFFIPAVRFFNSHAHHHCHYKSSRVRSTDHGGHRFEQLLPIHYPGKWILARQWVGIHDCASLSHWSLDNSPLDFNLPDYKAIRLWSSGMW